MPEVGKTMLDASQVSNLLDQQYPQLLETGERSYLIEAVGAAYGRLRLIYSPRHRRPGGTISGPSMFTLADLTLYATILAQIGAVPLVVTTSMTIDFLRKPEPRDLVAECRLIKSGKRLIFGTVTLTSDGLAAPVAHASGTYSVPPRNRGITLPLPTNT
jgi:acyl-coenzyme A thioesterase PaaI-like protein